MARLRPQKVVGELRLRMAAILRDQYGPMSSARHEWEDGLMWEVFGRERVDLLLSGAPVDMYAWELPEDIRRPFHSHDRVRLVGNDVVQVEAWVAITAVIAASTIATVVGCPPFCPPSL